MWTVLVLGVAYGGVLALVAAGLTLVFGVMNVVNFAHGDVVMVAMISTAALAAHTRLGPYAAGAVVVAASIPLLALVYGAVIRGIIARSLHVHIFATIGLSLVLQAAALVTFGPGIRSISDAATSARVTITGVTIESGRLIAFITAIVLAAALWFFLRRARLGREIRAVAANPAAALLVGLRMERVRAVTFIGGGLLAVIAGVLIIPFQPVKISTGISFTLISFVIVVLGGLGSLPGALLGGLIVGVVHTAVGYYIGTAWPMVALFVVFLAAILLRPQGLAHRGTAQTIFGEARV